MSVRHARELSAKFDMSRRAVSYRAQTLRSGIEYFVFLHSFEIRARYLSWQVKIRFLLPQNRGQILNESTFRDLSEEFEFETCMDDMPVSATEHNFMIDWFVEVELDVPWAKNPSIRCPVTVVHHRG